MGLIHLKVIIYPDLQPINSTTSLPKAKGRMHQVTEVLGEKRLRRLSELHGMLGRFSSHFCGHTNHGRKAKGDGFSCFFLLVSPAVLKWDFSCTWHVVKLTHFNWKEKHQILSKCLTRSTFDKLVRPVEEAGATDECRRWSMPPLGNRETEK